MVKYYLKQLAFLLSPLFVGLGIQRLISFFRDERGHILMFHRVVPTDGRKRLHNHLSLEITPEKLQEILLFFIERKYDVISLDQVEDYRKGNKKFVVFTFDDGYYDNLKYAYPIFKKYSCPFTIYIQNSFPNGNAFVWWYILEEVLLKENFIRIKTDTFSLSKKTITYTQKEVAFVAIRDAINNGSLPLDKFGELLLGKGIDWKERSKRFSLSWSDLRHLCNDPLVTIGSHTVSHLALKSLTKEKAYTEIKGSKDELELILEKKIHHFSYPFGSRREVGKKDVRLVEEIGFKTAVTTILGNINDKQKLSQLPRITVNALTSISVLKMQLSGLYSRLDNGLKGYKI